MATYRAVLVTRVSGRLRRGKAFVTLQYGDDRYVVREAVFYRVLSCSHNGVGPGLDLTPFDPALSCRGDW